MDNTTKSFFNEVASIASTSFRSLGAQSDKTHLNRGTKLWLTFKSVRFFPCLSFLSQHHSRNLCLKLLSFPSKLLAKTNETLERPQVFANTIPKLHKAKTVICGLLK